MDEFCKTLLVSGDFRKKINSDYNMNGIREFTWLTTVASESPGGLVDTQTAGPQPRALFCESRVGPGNVHV